jgi:glutamate synthase (NADPH) large chain
MTFLPKDKKENSKYKKVMEEICNKNGVKPLFWRTVPVTNSFLPEASKLLEPSIEQLFVAPVESFNTQIEFERVLFVIRHMIENLYPDKHEEFYICSFSSLTCVYKGLLTPNQFNLYFDDVHDPDFESYKGMVHSRFSTNTHPSWSRAQPLRAICHNGEINTLRGNLNQLKSREYSMKSNLLKDLNNILPIVKEGGSDSAAFDNVAELLMMSGRTLMESLLLMVPEAWQNDSKMSDDKRNFYEYNSMMMEPWDGPGLFCFTDGEYLGAILDRNGLRPARYYLTKDGFVIMGSEVGLIEIPEENVLKKGRLQPGKMYLIDFNEKRLVNDDETKLKYINSNPYGEWLKKNTVHLNEIPNISSKEDFGDLKSAYLKYGYSREFFHVLFPPMITNGSEAIGSMGNDQTLACLSKEPKLIFQYFKQLFAQVTNPPIDPIREKIVVSLRCPIGPEHNILEISPKHCERLILEHPIVENEQLTGLLDFDKFKSEKIICSFTDSMEESINEICKKAEDLVKSGVGYLILSDKTTNPEEIPIPSLFICGAVHHHLISCKLRTKTALIIESGDAKLVHHICLLLGYGADAVNPWLIFNILKMDYPENYEEYKENYIESISKGILKVMSKMGVSCLQSYKGAQIFEAVGIHSSVVDKCFKNTSSRIEGVKFNTFESDARYFHNLSIKYQNGDDDFANLMNFGQIQWRSDGDEHLHNPQTVTLLQHAVRSKSSLKFDEYVEEADKASEKSLLRGLLKLKYSNNPVPLDEVEPAKKIVERFVTGAMSYGSISTETHETIAKAMNKINGKSNTGEGGEDPERFLNIDKDGYSSRSSIKQIASGRFGVTIEYLTNSDVIQIKLAQGAKPGEVKKLIN